MKIRIILKSFEKDIIKEASQQIYNICSQLEGCETFGIVALPIQLKKFCVLRSPHIDKDSREHFELRLYKHFIDIIVHTSDILDSLLNITLPMGITSSIKILNEDLPENNENNELILEDSEDIDIN